MTIFGRRIYSRLAAALFLTLLSASAARAAEEARLWIRGATLVDVSAGEPAGTVDVVVSGERIAAVTRAGLMEPPEGSRVIEAEGLWLAPGAFDAHVHVSGVPGMVAFDTAEKEELRDLYRAQVGKSYLLHGFTQVVDLNHVSEAAVAFLDEAGPAPDFLHVGTGLTMAGGYPLVFVPEEERWAYSNFLLAPEALPASMPEGVSPADHTPEAAVERVVAAETAPALRPRALRRRGSFPARGLPPPACGRRASGSPGGRRLRGSPGRR